MARGEDSSSLIVATTFVQILTGHSCDEELNRLQNTLHAIEALEERDKAQSMGFIRIIK